jgi:hypothetical protein
MGSREISRRRAKCGSWIAEEFLRVAYWWTKEEEEEEEKKRGEDGTEDEKEKRGEKGSERESRRRMECALSNGAVVSLFLYFFRCRLWSSPIDRV